MAGRTSKRPAADPSSATIGFEAKLWLAENKLRNYMDAAEYKHVVLGLSFDMTATERTRGQVSRHLKQQDSNHHQSRTLATLRYTLLPKLLSGELSVN